MSGEIPNIFIKNSSLVDLIRASSQKKIVFMWHNVTYLNIAILWRMCSLMECLR